MTSLYQWKVYCTDESKWVETDYWQEEPPTTCPNDSANHTIGTGANAPTSFNEIKDGKVSIDEGFSDGHYKYKGEKVVMPASHTALGDITADIATGATVWSVSQSVIDNASLDMFVKLGDGTNNEIVGKIVSINDNDNTITVDPTEGGLSQAFLSATPTTVYNITTTKNFVQPYDIGVCSYAFNSSEDNNGDGLVVDVYPNALVGAITANVATGDTVINVQQSVVDNIKRGFYCRLMGGGVQECMGRVTSIDKTNNQITVEKSATVAMSAASPVLVYMTVKMLEAQDIGPPGKHQGGEDKIGSSIIPEGVTVTVHYSDYAPKVGGKKFIFYVGHLYGTA